MFNYHPKSLAQSVINTGERVHDLIEFRYTLLDNLPLLRQRDDNVVVTITQAEADQFYGDFYGLLSYLKAPMDLFWITTVLNNYSDSTAFDAEVLDITIPSQAEINRIKVIFLSVNGN